MRHADVKLVSFTGSAAVGREIASVCGQQLKRISLELGGKNAQIVMEDADLNLALEGALWGAFGTTGQRCTATSRLILHRDIKKELTDMLVARAENPTLRIVLQQSLVAMLVGCLAGWWLAPVVIALGVVLGTKTIAL